MSSTDLSYYQKRVKQMGTWMGVRFMRNRGVPFEFAYLVIFGKLPIRTAP